MPFMKGFGEGFANSFAQRQALDAQAERDQFSVAYETYTKNKAKYDADKKADETYKDQAKKIVSGLPNVDPNAWTYAYDQLKAGFSAGQVEDKLLTTKFAPIPQAPQPTGVDAEMAGAGLNPDGTPKPVDLMSQNDPTTIQQPPENVMAKPTMTNNPFANIGKNVQNKITEIGNPKLQMQNQANAANEKVKGLVGEGYDEAMSGFTPEPVVPLVTPQAMPTSPLAEFGLDKGPLTTADLARVDSEAAIGLKSSDPDLKAKALKWIAMRPDINAALEAGSGTGGVDANGNPVIDVDFENKLATIVGGIETPRTELSQRKGSLLSLQDNFKELDGLLQKNGSLNTWGAKVGTGLETLKTNVISMVDMADQFAGTDFGGSLEDFVSQIEQRSPGWKRMSEDERAFSAALLKLQYTYSRGALGQTGNSQSNQDIERVKDILINSVDPKQAIEQLKSLIRQDASALNYEISSIMNGSAELQIAILAQKQHYESAPGKADGISSYEKTLGPLSEDQLAWANSPTPDISVKDPTLTGTSETAPDTEPKGKPTGKGIVQNEADQAALEAKTGQKVPIGTTYTEYENGIEIDE